MNDKFFQLSLKKQVVIINAAYKVFALSEYKKAPMSEIAAESGISKALLFHYFGNKLGLYMFLWNKCMQDTMSVMKEYRVIETDDFFEMLSRSLRAKCSVMKKHPYSALFSLTAYYEKNPEVKERIQSNFAHQNKHALQTVLARVDSASIDSRFSIEEVYQEIIYASDGYLLERFRLGEIDADEMEMSYMKMIDLWKRAYGRSYGK